MSWAGVSALVHMGLLEIRSPSGHPSNFLQNFRQAHPRAIEPRLDGLLTYTENVRGLRFAMPLDRPQDERLLERFGQGRDSAHRAFELLLGHKFVIGQRRFVRHVLGVADRSEEHTSELQSLMR